MSMYWRKPSSTQSQRETKRALRPCLRCDVPFKTTILRRICSNCTFVINDEGYSHLLEADQWHEQGGMKGTSGGAL